MSEPRWIIPGILKSRDLGGFQEWYVIVKYPTKEYKGWITEGKEYILSNSRANNQIRRYFKLKEGSEVQFLVGEYSAHIGYTTLICPCCGDYQLRPEDYHAYLEGDLDIKK